MQHPRETAVQALAAPDSPQPSAADFVERHQISTRTARRRIHAACQLGDGTGAP
ncbi:hypothetical protein ACFWHQ_29805 [Streptomyces sp. NPDC060334]|uniref:hypothetical protein n=1 Tax=unclassified Streptomyces TaxID=2593676 RepID=UPI003660947F